MAGTLPLLRWFSRQRFDYNTTSDPRWRDQDATEPPDYQFREVQGRVVVLPEEPAPTGYRLLRNWWSSDRSDHHATTDGRWADPDVTEPPDYRFIRDEGYVFAQPYAGTVPLYRWWHSARTEHLTTSHPDWAEGGVAEELGYRYLGIDGWMYPPSSSTFSSAPAARFGKGGRSRQGGRPLFLILVDYLDSEIQPGVGQDAEDYFNHVVFGDAPSVVSLMSAVSHGRLQFFDAGTTRLTLQMTYAQATAMPVNQYDSTVLRAAAQAGADFARFDDNGDGILDGGDISVLAIQAQDPTTPDAAGGQTRWQTARVGGILFANVPVAFTWDLSDISSFAHELQHCLDVDQHIYGPGGSVNNRLSLFAAAQFRSASDAGPVQLDPWNKVLARWIEPRCVAINEAAGSVRLYAPESSGFAASQPLLFFDPTRSLDEFFLVEYRNPDIGLHDSGARFAGVAVWAVRRGSDGRAVPVTWPPPGVSWGRTDVMPHNYVIGSAGPGRGPLWTDADGTFPLSWYDGSDSGLRLRVGPVEHRGAAVAVQWKHRDHPFRPRLDRCTSQLQRDVSTTVSVQGVFPLEGPLYIELRHVGGTRIADLGSVQEPNADSRLLLRDVKLDMPPGTYEMGVRSAEGITSNGLHVSVVPAADRPPVH